MALNAVGALQMTKTNNSNHDITLLRIPAGRRQTSWLFTERGRRFELGTTVKNPANGQAGT